MPRFVAITIVLLAAGAAAVFLLPDSQTVHADDAPTTPETSRTDGKRVQIVVVDPPAKFDAGAEMMGFVIMERVELTELGMKIIRLRVPSGTTINTARERLVEKFPKLEVDTTGQFDLSKY